MVCYTRLEFLSLSRCPPCPPITSLVPLPLLAFVLVLMVPPEPDPRLPIRASKGSPTLLLLLLLLLALLCVLLLGVEVPLLEVPETGEEVTRGGSPAAEGGLGWLPSSPADRSGVPGLLAIGMGATKVPPVLGG